MMWGSHGASAPARRFVISIPSSIDYLVRAMHRDLLSQSVPERLLQLIEQNNSQDEPPPGKGVPHDGSKT
jgi:hypothetical protein